MAAAVRGAMRQPRNTSPDGLDRQIALLYQVSVIKTGAPILVFR